MKNWKKWMLTGMSVMMLGMGVTAYPSAEVHAKAQLYDRSDNVAPEEARRVGATEKKVSPKAWKKIKGVCYNGSGKEIPGAITRGIDVSEWQEKIDWGKVAKSDVDFAFIRIAHGLSHIDRHYDYNMKEAELAGIPVGTYVYSTAVTKVQAIQEAQLAIRKMNGYKVSYPVVFDLEDEDTTGRLSEKAVSEIALAFCNEIKNAGYTPMLYMNTNWYNNYVDWNTLAGSGLDVWIARYGDTIQAPDRSQYNYTIWQSTSGDEESGLNPTTGLINGIPVWNGVDMNFGFVDYTKKITPRWSAKNDYVPSSIIDKTKTGSYKENGKNYYYKEGEKVSGWQKVKGNYYYYDPETFEMVKDTLLKLGNKLYYVDENGKQYRSQWLTKDKRKYYFLADGTAASGATKISGICYYFNSKNNAMRKNYRYVSKGKSRNVYYFGSDGAWVKNKGVRITVNGKRGYYYFGANRKAYTGWKTIRGKKYYFYGKKSKYVGMRAENVTLTDSKGLVSVFDKKGVCIKQYQEEASN